MLWQKTQKVRLCQQSIIRFVFCVHTTVIFAMHHRNICRRHHSFVRGHSKGTMEDDLGACKTLISRTLSSRSSHSCMSAPSAAFFSTLSLSIAAKSPAFLCHIAARRVRKQTSPRKPNVPKCWNSHAGGGLSSAPASQSGKGAHRATPRRRGRAWRPRSHAADGQYFSCTTHQINQMRVGLCTGEGREGAAQVRLIFFSQNRALGLGFFSDRFPRLHKLPRLLLDLCRPL